MHYSALHRVTSLKTSQEHGLTSLCKHRHYLEFICSTLNDVCIQMQKMKRQNRLQKWKRHQFLIRSYGTNVINCADKMNKVICADIVLSKPQWETQSIYLSKIVPARGFQCSVLLLEKQGLFAERFCYVSGLSHTFSSAVKPKASAFTSVMSQALCVGEGWWLWGGGRMVSRKGCWGDCPVVTVISNTVVSLCSQM